MKKQVIKLGIAALIGASGSGCSSYSQSPISVKGKVIDTHTDGVVIDTTQPNSHVRKGLRIEGLDSKDIFLGDSIELQLDTISNVAVELDIIRNLN